jgi:hypothetical protein
LQYRHLFAANLTSDKTAVLFIWRSPASTVLQVQDLIIHRPHAFSFLVFDTSLSMEWEYEDLKPENDALSLSSGVQMAGSARSKSPAPRRAGSKRGQR